MDVEEQADDAMVDDRVAAAGVVEASPRPEPAPISAAPPEPPAGAAIDGEHPVVMLMGRDTLIRLATRHAGLLQRISEETADADQRATWRARAEQLDPASWSTIEAAVAGIEHFEREVRALEAELAGPAAGSSPPSE